MTIEREYDPDATVEMPLPVQIDTDIEEVDPEKTLVREDWESVVIRRIAPHVAAVQSSVAEGPGAVEARFGWETEGLRRLSREMARERDE